jgi:hypothetical protein
MRTEESIRQEIILQLYASRPLALTAERMSRNARREGDNYSTEEIAREADFVEGEKLAEKVAVPGSTTEAWKLTAAGVRHYEQHLA